MSLAVMSWNCARWRMRAPRQCGEGLNYERPHESLGMKCPAELYCPSERKYEGTPQDLDYAQMCPRRVSTSGAIKFEGQSLFLSSALAGWSVGLKPITGDRLEVWFG